MIVPYRLLYLNTYESLVEIKLFIQSGLFKSWESSICAVPGLEEKHSGEEIHSDIIIFRYFIQTQ